MARINLTLTLRKRWWFGIAYATGLVACALRLMTEERAERFIKWLVNEGMSLDAHLA